MGAARKQSKVTDIGLHGIRESRSKFKEIQMTYEEAKTAIAELKARNRRLVIDCECIAGEGKGARLTIESQALPVLGPGTWRVIVRAFKKEDDAGEEIFRREDVEIDAATPAPEPDGDTLPPEELSAMRLMQLENQRTREYYNQMQLQSNTFMETMSRLEKETREMQAEIMRQQLAEMREENKQVREQMRDILQNVNGDEGDELGGVEKLEKALGLMSNIAGTFQNATQQVQKAGEAGKPAPEKVEKLD